MMDNILLVLAITEGRHFPKRPHHQLLVEASFDTEVLCTDMIKHGDSPKFNTELAWEIDKKSLHHHRLKRTPLKIQIFAVEDSSMKKELIGYCLLDLRSAGTVDNKKLSWHSILGSKYQNTKPEIRTSLSIEVDKVKEEETKEKTPKKADSVEDLSNLDVVLDDEKGYYLIGPESVSCEIYVLSISIGGARNLIKLLPSNEDLKTDDGFYFYYSLFDNDVTNETFHDLMSTTIPIERATVRIYTTPRRLEAYIQNKRILEVYLCSGSSTLGQATISLQPLVSSPIGKEASKVEGLFPLTTTVQIEDNTALVGVSIVLRKEVPEIPRRVSPVFQNINPKVNMPVSPDLQIYSPTSTPIKQVPTNTKTEKSPPVTPPPKEVPGKAKIKKTPQKKSPPILRTDLVEDERRHHFIYSIDIRSISNMDIQQPVYCLCRYTYPFFGSSAPILTNPAVLVHRNSEVLFPQSFCKFEFASSLKQLKTMLSRTPLVIEIWTKDKNVKDQLFGIAQVNLSSILGPDIKTSAGEPVIKSEKVPVIYADKPGKKVAIIHVVLGYEDKGVIVSNVPPLPNPHQQSISTAASEVPSTENDDAGPRATQEYQVAMALEFWRQQQEEHFKNELTSKENERMKVIAEEWKQRDLEREVLVKRKLEEYQTLELKLKKTLEDLEAREKKVLEFDEQLQRKEKLLTEEYDRKAAEFTEQSRRLREEFDHQLLLEKRQYADLDKRYKILENEKIDLRQQLKEKDTELFALKESLVNRPEVKIQSDMNMLLLEKGELERKIESITKSKIHYKQQWGRALRELARIKLNEQEAAKTRLKKQQEELDHMKLRYMAAEEKKIIDTEKEEFKDVKEEINKKLEELQSAVESTNRDNKAKSVITDELDEHNKARIAKLIEERDTLLQTGVYTLEDRVISELDNEIQQMIQVNA